MGDDSDPNVGLMSGCEQLLYTNVDHVVDGVERSGWQTMTQTAGLSDGDASTLYALIDPTLNPVTPLSGFPTEQEVAAADRRLAQFWTDEGLVLVHTAPAGNDTTGRPNTMTHVVLAKHHEPAPDLRTIDLWRSPGWVTPFGPEQVRQAELPDPASLRPGASVDDDTVAEFLADGSRSPALVAMADALEPGLLQTIRAQWDGVPSDQARRRNTVVLAVSSTDEAALWIGALLRTCAPATGRYLSYSVLQRILTPSDVEMLLQSRIDVACVPRQDLTNMGESRPGLVVIDPHESGAVEPAPTTSWGRLVALMSQDLGAWVAAYEGMKDVLSLLPDHSDLSPGWPLAAAEACDPGFLEPQQGETPSSSQDEEARAQDEAELIEVELVSCYPRSMVGNDYLAAVVTDRVLGSATQNPAAWYARLSRIPRWAPVSGLVSGLCERYLDAACREVRWMTDLERPVSEQANRCLRQWSGMPEHRSTVDAALAQAKERVEAEQPGTAGGLRVLDRMLREHVSVSTRTCDVLLQGYADMMQPAAYGSREQREILAVPAISLSRSLLADRVSWQLDSEEHSGRLRVLPSLSREVLDWLSQDNEPGNRVQIEAQVALTQLAAGGKDAGRACRALGRLGGLFSLQPTVVEVLSQQATPDMLQYLPHGCQNFHEIFSEVLARRYDSENADKVARTYLDSHGLTDRSLTIGINHRFSPSAAMSLVVLSRGMPLMSRRSDVEVLHYAGNVLSAICALAAHHHDLGRDPVRQAMVKALGVLLAGVWSGKRILLEGVVWKGDGPEVRSVNQKLEQVMAELPDILQRHPEYLISDDDNGPGVLMQPLVRNLYFSSGVRMSESMVAQADEQVSQLRQSEMESSALFSGKHDAALATARAVIARGGAGAVELWRPILYDLFDHDAGARRWVDKTLLSAASRGSGSRRRILR